MRGIEEDGSGLERPRKKERRGRGMKGGGGASRKYSCQSRVSVVIVTLWYSYYYCITSRERAHSTVFTSAFTSVVYIDALYWGK